VSVCVCVYVRERERERDMVMAIVMLNRLTFRGKLHLNPTRETKSCLMLKLERRSKVGSVLRVRYGVTVTIRQTHSNVRKEEKE